MELSQYDDIKQYHDMFCVNGDNLMKSVENLETILLSVESVFESLPIDSKIKIHFPDFLTLKYSVKDWDDQLNFRVLIKDVLHVIQDKNDLNIDTISAQTVDYFRFFNSDYEVKFDSPRYFNDPVEYILGVDQ
jgi:hypothetical protein